MARKKIYSDPFEEGEFNEKSQSMSLFAELDGADAGAGFDTEIPGQLPILPLREMVLFPTVIIPISIGRKSSLKLVRQVNKSGGLLGAFCQKNPNEDDPELKDLYNVGCMARIVKIFDMPDRSTTVVLQGIQRIKLSSIVKSEPYSIGAIEPFIEVFPQKDEKLEFNTMVQTCKEICVKCMESSDSIPREAFFALNNLTNGILLVNFICCNLFFDTKGKMSLLRETTFMSRALRLISMLNQELQISQIKMRIQRNTHHDIDKQQKEYFLQQQIKNIQEELGEDDSLEHEIDDMRRKGEKKRWSKEVAETFEREVSKLERINPQSPDYNVQFTYLQTLLSLPWGECTKDNLNLTDAARILNKDHYGLEKVKERILEHLAVLKLRGDLKKSPILCLYGPPGVGKTSLGHSIAKALKRKYVRISLGGLHDESEIRGHRKTYIGAMPGRIIKNLIKAGSDNPVFILDEIDKVGQMTHNGDPSSALLEVLDPEQNSAFHDNFLDMDYDLSKVMFIATANNINTIPTPLLDRMELIEVSGYVTEEKIEIARKHLIPKQLEANGIHKKGSVKLPNETIEKIIEDYTRESGVRGLEKSIGKLFRKIAYKSAVEGTDFTGTVKTDVLKELLGTKPHSRDHYQGNEYAGVVTGLAWTAVGGEILFVETSLSRGKESKLTLTGNLGDVMKESAMLALEYTRSHAALLNLDPALFSAWNIHIHVPEGAIPKDGPSAGITMATSIASAFTQRKVRANLAMTGEITLRGKVLPVGGIREKILAAKRAGITDIMLCAENKRDIEDIPEDYLKGVTFHYVENIRDVWEFALLEETVRNPQSITV